MRPSPPTREDPYTPVHCLLNLNNPPHYLISHCLPWIVKSYSLVSVYQTRVDGAGRRQLDLIHLSSSLCHEEHNAWYMRNA